MSEELEKDPQRNPIRISQGIPRIISKEPGSSKSSRRSPTEIAKASQRQLKRITKESKEFGKRGLAWT
eukprot:6359992-Pyramimonas_sp.AAC.1